MKAINERVAQVAQTKDQDQLDPPFFEAAKNRSTSSHLTMAFLGRHKTHFGRESLQTDGGGVRQVFSPSILPFCPLSVTIGLVVRNVIPLLKLLITKEDAPHSELHPDETRHKNYEIYRKSVRFTYKQRSHPQPLESNPTILLIATYHHEFE